MKLYDKKVPINENCMISNFGQPGGLCPDQTVLFVPNFEETELYICLCCFFIQISFFQNSGPSVDQSLDLHGTSLLFTAL